MKAAIIGNGWIARNAHKRSFDSLKAEGSDIELVALCDVRPEMLANNTGERLYSNVDEMLEKETELDFVVICLPTYMHADCAVKCMKAGLHVLCEKPMALTEEECDRMINCSKETGKRVMIGQCCRFTDPRRIMKRYIEEGILGKPLTAFFCSADAAPLWGWEDWFKDEKRSGGCMLDLQAHNIDLINWFFGVPDFTSTMARACKPDFSGYGSVSANLGYDNGLIVHSWVDWGIDINNHNKRYIRINFEKGYLYQDMNQNPFFVEVNYDGTTKDLSEEKTIFTTDYRAELEYFADCVKNNLPFDICPAEDCKNVIKVMRAQEKSADNQGACVRI